jgi:hypothetical protein
MQAKIEQTTTSSYVHHKKMPIYVKQKSRRQKSFGRQKKIENNLQKKIIPYLVMASVGQAP